MPNGIMEEFFNRVLEQATYSGRNKGIFFSKNHIVYLTFWPHPRAPEGPFGRNF